MTAPEDRRGTAAWKELLGEDRDLLSELIHTVVGEMLEAEMTEAVGAERGEREESRLGYRSGYYTRTLITRVGKLERQVPRDRDGRFSTELFERYQRSEKAPVSALMEMYVAGLSTRKVKLVTEELCGHAFSASSIRAIDSPRDARVGKGLNERPEESARRRLETLYPYPVLDARHGR
jgi:putative transposase